MTQIEIMMQQGTLNRVIHGVEMYDNVNRRGVNDYDLRKILYYLCLSVCLSRFYAYIISYMAKEKNHSKKSRTFFPFSTISFLFYDH